MTNLRKIADRRSQILLVVAALASPGCGGSDSKYLVDLSSGGVHTSGGAGNAGGSISSGGHSSTSTQTTTGGANTAGGNNVGGSTATGGASTSSAGATQGGTFAAGGNSATGGFTSAGGGTAATGGRASTGGTATTSTSSAAGAGTGGVNGTGGRTGTGGITSGGASSIGGAIGTGGVTAAGGATGTGGGTPTGGALGTGGVTPTGGTRATGGASATGGVAVTGGAPATGGSSPAIGGAASTLHPVSDVSLGVWHSCGLMQDQTVKCWGNDDYGQLGTAGATVSSTCFPAAAITGTPQICVAPVAITGLSTVTALAAGGYHACALITGGAVKCWGRNDRGQLGDGTTVSKATLVTPITSGALGIAAGRFHSCAVMTGGAVRCWGSSENGQLGASGLPGDCTSAYFADFAQTETYCPTPFNVVGVSSATAVAAGYGHTCALISDGSVRCWGDNSEGQLGHFTSISPSAPVAVDSVSSVKQVVANDVRSCTMSGTGNIVQCWGHNQWGEVGNGNTTEQDTPVPVVNLPSSPSVLSVATGAGHTCTLMSDGTLRCWGDNQFGELATTTATPVTTPVTPVGLNGAVSAVSAGGGHTCAVLSADHSVQCWGRNQRGQLGNGTTTDSTAPLFVTGP